MPKKKEEAAPPAVLWECSEPRCDYKIYDAGDEEAGKLYKADHIRQHEDPEGWKADNT